MITQSTPGEPLSVHASMVTCAGVSGAADCPDSPSVRQKGSS
jgi:hypothetical protein